MGTHAERVAIKDQVVARGPGRVRARQPPERDRRHRRGRFEAELAPVTVRDAKGRETVVAVDEGPRRDTTAEALAKLGPAFDLPERRGSRLGDDRHRDRRQRARDHRRRRGDGRGQRAGRRAFGLQPLARIVGYAQAEVAPKWLFLAPVAGVRGCSTRIELPIEAFDLIEINEAFAAQALADGRELGLRLGKVNVNGGAIALGHPIGASGARIVATLLHELSAARGPLRPGDAVPGRRRLGRDGVRAGLTPMNGPATRARQAAAHGRCRASRDRAGEHAARDADVQLFIAGEWVDSTSAARRSRAATPPTRATWSGTFQAGDGGGRRPRAIRAAGDAPAALAPHAGAEARRDPVPLRRADGRAQGAPRPGDDPRDGQGPRGGARRRPGGHRHRLPDGRRGPPDVRRHGAVASCPTSGR